MVFLSFANFYERFIYSFGKIAEPLNLMAKTSSATRSLKNLPLSIDVAEFNEVDIGGGDCEDETVEKSLSKNLNRATGYFTPAARSTFTQLRKAFTKALIFQHFDPKCHIRIKTDASSYAIGRVLNQLTLNNFDQWNNSLQLTKNDFSQKLLQNS